jgi:hypothetical protein
LQPRLLVTTSMRKLILTGIFGGRKGALIGTTVGGGAGTADPLTVRVPA